MFGVLYYTIPHSYNMYGTYVHDIIHGRLYDYVLKLSKDCTPSTFVHLCVCPDGRSLEIIDFKLSFAVCLATKCDKLQSQTLCGGHLPWHGPRTGTSAY